MTLLARRVRAVPSRTRNGTDDPHARGHHRENTAPQGRLIGRGEIPDGGPRGLVEYLPFWNHVVESMTETRVERMRDELIGRKVVVDLKHRFVCLGTLQDVTEQLLELRNADVHDLEDTQTSREVYVADSAATGIKRNRRRVWIVRSEVVAISLLEDVVDD